VSLVEGGAEPALSILFLRGCDPLIVLNLLRAYSGIGLSLGLFKEEFRKWRHRLERMLKRLSEDADELRSIDHYLRLGLDLPHQMDKFREDLEVMISIEESELNQTVLARGGGRQVYLALAARSVEVITKRPRYSKLTEILSAMTGKVLGEDALRKDVANYMVSEVFDSEQFELDLGAIVAQNRTNRYRLTKKGKNRR
jgi:hypothetical protein